MKRYIVCVLALATMAPSTPADAQVGGLLRKKAGEVLGKKPEPAKPAPTPAPATETAPATPASPATPPAASPTAAPAPAAASNRDAAPAAPKNAGSALDVSALPVHAAANQVLRGRFNERPNGDWDQLPSIPAAATAAAYALNDSARATLVETVGSALKTLVMSAAYVTEHNAFIKGEHQGVDHGLKGVVTLEEAMKKGDMKQMEALQTGMMVTVTVDQVKAMPGDILKTQLMESLPRWKEYAANPKNSARAKYQKMVAKAQSIETLPTSDEKFKRGYAVIQSIDNGGPDTEEAVYALAARSKQEQEQAAYDAHSLKGQLKQQLTAFVAIASKVNFNAPTVEKNRKTMFVNAADEKQGAIWKGCFRAGQPATAAALKLAKAWLAEL
jgi:hypothetical protein